MIRDPNLNKVNCPIFHSSDILVNIYKKMCFSRFFENKVASLYKEGIITNPIYLSAGQESISAALSEVLKDWYIFTQHRCHSIYLSFGGDAKKLTDELLGLPSGCNGGKGGSPGLQDLNIKMIGHHGLIGENVPLATGFSLATRKNTMCFFGDGAAEEDYVGASMGFAATHKLPILFVCTDNDLSVLTKTQVRRSWNVADIAMAYGLNAIDICDDPWTILSCVENLKFPAFINIRTNRIFWHVGAGIDNTHDWDRLTLFAQELVPLGIDTTRIEKEEKDRVDSLWNSHLQKQLGK